MPPETRCWIIGGARSAEADPERIAQTRSAGEIDALLDDCGLDVAPGVRIALLGTGDHLHFGKVRWGALIAVRTEAPP